MTEWKGNRAAVIAAWVAVATVALYLRLWQFGAQIIIDDEWHAINKLKDGDYTDIFLSFGHADHSIPLTLFYEFIANSVGLDEWNMQLPMLLSGLGTVFLVPWLLRRWTSPWERVTAGALLAVSPVLVHFSRLARPYAITLPLVVVALTSLFLWWREGGRGRAFVYVLCTTLAAWLHPVTLAFTMAGLARAGLAALVGVFRERDWLELRRVFALGAATLLPCALLLAPPLWHDYASLSVKSGLDYPGAESLLVAWQLLVGSGYRVQAGIAVVLTLFGAYRLYRRDRSFAGYLGLVGLLSVMLIVTSGAEWSHQGVVLMGYLLPLLPFLVACWAIGVCGLFSFATRRLTDESRAYSAAAGFVLVMATLYWMGPLPEQYRGINQFTGHMIYQYDYDRERSDYRRALADIPVPDFYRDMRAAGENWEVVEAPWRLESHFNPLYKYQSVHQLPVKIGFLDGLCADGLYGEYEAGTSGLEFEHFLHLEDLLADPGGKRFVVIHKGPASPGWRELPVVAPCIEAFRSRFGPPWRETANAVVFRFEGNDT